ncbi:hypothetical protein A2973_04105 [Candidatus Gottesmanbacteria bacterium RIFCSPLOWO2_01_FULL_49_10]|uniref:L,D-TPase catalytic domain-containing protein n=1 Tax=Candidatus Gottesmanbacteria bacterium RIFCSPLOWO2_01_FULL_49_10 TaxID=1798396 RepID=A0A1F6B0R8_9BACT|nr:MAG: hypothetical protein A2973_04105 [Candidatus Gottesmanbacteria bacterium RIFCSPLOWO2_01_FULL_49_10]
MAIGLKLSKHESSWIRIFGFLSVLILAVLFIRPLLPASYHTDEPLADKESLEKLVNGQDLPVPIDDSYAVFHNNEVTPPTSAQLADISLPAPVLGSTSEDKRIEVDLSHQKVYAYQGEQKVYEFTVSTGKWYPTPTGEFRIWTKVRSQLMKGGDRTIGTYYYLPNVPYVMFFANDQVRKMRGFSLHGAYWHNNFGHPMSHGCINMKIEDAHTLYDWAQPTVTNPKAWSTNATADNPGTRVVIYGQTPKE